MSESSDFVTLVSRQMIWILSFTIIFKIEFAFFIAWS